MKKNIIFLMIVLLISISGCIVANTPQPATQMVATPSISYPAPDMNMNTTYPYPYPFAAPIQPLYPYPGMEQPTPVTIPSATPTADPVLGVVKGRLLEAQAPVYDISLFLAEVKKGEDGKDLIARLSFTNSQRVETNPDGYFEFVNVTPGRYALILYTGSNAFLINVPDKADPILFDVEVGKTTDLGDLNYDDLPL